MFNYKVFSVLCVINRKVRKGFLLRIMHIKRKVRKALSTYSFANFAFAKCEPKQKNFALFAVK